MGGMTMNYVKDIERDGEYVEGLAKVDLFSKEFKVISYVHVPIHYIERCVEHLDNLSDELLDKLRGYLFKYAMDYQKYFDMTNESDVKKAGKIYGGGPTNILSCVKLQNVLISGGATGVEVTDATVPTFSLECRCLWDFEHGLEIVISGNEIKYVGQFDNIGLWKSDDYYKKVFGNYVYDNPDDIDDEYEE